MSAIEHPGYAISTDPQRLDVLMVHAYLTQSAWSPGIPIEVCRRSNLPWLVSRN
jgi:hypothetical protein